MKTAIFMESTGIYHLTLFHYLCNKFNTFVLNPLVTNCNKNKDIRKVKNDKKDALSIAKIGKYENPKCSSKFDIEIYSLKTLCRDYYKLVDTKSNFKKKLSMDLKVVFPGYSSVFSDTTCKTSMAILKEFPMPKDILSADKNYLIELIKNTSKKGDKYSTNLLKKLISTAEEASYIALNLSGFSVKTRSILATIEAFDEQINTLVEEINILVESDKIPDSFKKNLSLLLSMPGLGKLTGITISSEIGDIKNFKKAKQLVAFLGIDPSVNESGNFKSDSNKMSKRGSKFGRRALYAAALASVRKTNGKPVNAILLNYYNETLNKKAKKAKLGAVMHKLTDYIFSVLKNQKEFEFRDPKVHSQIYLNNKFKSAA